ncbi:MAG: hypothetical protein WA857_06885, partial [Candidatus Acidiferrum sp.]
LSSRAPGRSLAIQIRQALLLGLTYNLYRLRPALGPIGCQQSHQYLGETTQVLHLKNLGCTVPCGLIP